jgi:hypothetical protein
VNLERVNEFREPGALTQRWVALLTLSFVCVAVVSAVVSSRAGEESGTRATAAYMICSLAGLLLVTGSVTWRVYRFEATRDLMGPIGTVTTVVSGSTLVVMLPAVFVLRYLPLGMVGGAVWWVQFGVEMVVFQHFQRRWPGCWELRVLYALSFPVLLLFGLLLPDPVSTLLSALVAFSGILIVSNEINRFASVPRLPTTLV